MAHRPFERLQPLDTADQGRAHYAAAHLAGIITCDRPQGKRGRKEPATKDGESASALVWQVADSEGPTQRHSELADDDATQGRRGSHGNWRHDMSESTATSDPALTAIDRPRRLSTGTWTVDPADSSVTLAWRKLRLWSLTGQLPCLGVIHLDDLPPVGVIRFQQPSGLPVLTMALDPTSLETQGARLDAMLRGPDAVDVLRHRWWTLRSESLEVLAGGIWRVMATLTANGIQGLVELRLDVDPEASGPHWLVLRGRGVLELRAFGMGKRASLLGPTIQLNLTVRARRVETSTTESQQEEKVTCTTSMPS
jgi:polyisoprenoid-binding protein YceI